MPAVIAATMTASQKICRGEGHQAIGIKTKIAGHDGQRLYAGRLAMKRHHTVAANAGALPRFGWHVREEFIWNFRRLAPARAFADCHCAQLAIVQITAQRTARGVAVHWRLNRTWRDTRHASQAQVMADDASPRV